MVIYANYATVWLLIMEERAYGITNSCTHLASSYFVMLKCPILSTLTNNRDRDQRYAPEPI